MKAGAKFPTIAATIAATLFLASPAAALSSGQASFTLTTGDNALSRQDLVIDSNKCPTEGPVAMHLGGMIANTSGAKLTDVTATLTGVTLAGGQPATLSIGSLAAGQSYFVAWFVAYSCTDGAVGSATVTLGDANAGTVSRALTTRIRTAQSASAGGNVVSTTLGPGAIVGQIITADVNYDFGNISTGNEFFLQPAGATAFNAGCFRLLGATIISSNVAAAPVGVANQLRFVSSTSQSGNGYSIGVRFYYRYLCANTSTVARPFAAQTSGSSNIKYTGNYDGSGALVFSFPGATNPLTIAKSANPILFTGNAGGVATYTVTISNPSAYETTIDEIVDTLPAGVAFGAIGATSNITAANSSSVPASGAAGTIRFKANIGTSYALPAGGSLQLVYTATIPSTVGTYPNSAQAVIGAETIGPASVSIYVTASGALVVSKNVALYDPSSSGKFAIPGEQVVYTLSIQNVTGAAITAGSIVIEDLLPPALEFYNGDIGGGGPFLFSDVGSGLICCLAQAEYSTSATAPAVYGYSPIAGFDPNVRAIRITPSGAMNGAPASFTISFRMRIK